MRVKNLILAALCVLPFSLLAQSGILKGKVVDKTSGEELIGAAVFLQNEVTTGTITDPFGSKKTISSITGYYSDDKIVFTEHMNVESKIKDKRVSFCYLQGVELGLKQNQFDINLLQQQLQDSQQLLGQTQTTLSAEEKQRLLLQGQLAASEKNNEQLEQRLSLLEKK